MSIAVGKPAPDFTLNDAKGKPVELAKFKGKNVVVYFYPKNNTPGCTKEACSFRDLWSDIKALGVVVIGISPDTEESHRKFAAEHKLPFILLADPDKKVMKAYGAFGEKMMYGKKVEGVIRSTVWIGPDGLVKKHWAKVAKAETHPQAVLEALQAELS